jgi:hypothetical protein
MSSKLTIRLSEDGKSGVSRGRASGKQPFLRLAGAAEGPADLSTRKGFSRNCPSKKVPG